MAWIAAGRRESVAWVAARRRESVAGGRESVAWVAAGGRVCGVGCGRGERVCGRGERICGRGERVCHYGWCFKRAVTAIQEHLLQPLHFSLGACIHKYSSTSLSISLLGPAYTNIHRLLLYLYNMNNHVYKHYVE